MASWRMPLDLRRLRGQACRYNPADRRSWPFRRTPRRGRSRDRGRTTAPSWRAPRVRAKEQRAGRGARSVAWLYLVTFAAAVKRHSSAAVLWQRGDEVRRAGEQVSSAVSPRRRRRATRRGDRRSLRRARRRRRGRRSRPRRRPATGVSPARSASGSCAPFARQAAGAIAAPAAARARGRRRRPRAAPRRRASAIAASPVTSGSFSTANRLRQRPHRACDRRGAPSTRAISARTGT